MGIYNTMKISNLLIEWYQVNRRNLPWRNTNDPYKIWVSEIVLQQTRVNQGLDYYTRFVNEFPDIHTLASAPIQKVLKAWEGLGYYSRARNMHKAAIEVVNHHHGKIPDHFEGLKKLPGIGPYTAAAIASFAYNEPVAVVDGNVYRVLSRLHGIFTPINTTPAVKTFNSLANQVMDKSNPADFNQAIMEFGAMACLPANPQCPKCILKEHCYAFKNQVVHELPVKLSPRKKKVRYLYFIMLHYKNGVYIQQRISKDIWQGLYQFPMVESKRQLTRSKALATLKETFCLKDTELQDNACYNYKHILTHQEIRAGIFVAQTLKAPPSQHKWLFVPVGQLSDYPLPRLLNIFLEEQKTLDVR